MKKVLSIVLVFFIVVSLTGCFADKPKYELVEKVNMTIDYNSYLGYSANVTGKLKNTSNKQFLYIKVTFAIYDEHGNQITTAIDAINYLEKDNIWTFNASTITWFDVKPKSCKLVDVTYFFS